MSKSPTALGVDIGGSSTKMGVITKDGEILCQAIQPTPPELPADAHMRAILEKLTGLVDWAKKNDYSLQGIGVSVCGYLTPSGEEPDYINLHSLDHYPVARHLRDALDFLL